MTGPAVLAGAAGALALGAVLVAVSIRVHQRTVHRQRLDMARRLADRKQAEDEHRR